MNIDVFNLPTYVIPKTNITTDPLDLLLTGLSLRFAYLQKNSVKFQEKLAPKDFIFQIDTDTGIARHFIVAHGQITSVQGASPASDFTMRFKDSETAVKTLMKGDPAAFMEAVQKGDMSIQGDFSILMWFSSIAKYIPIDIPKPVLARVKQARKTIGYVRHKFGV